MQKFYQGIIPYLLTGLLAYIRTKQVFYFVLLNNGGFLMQQTPHTV